MKKRYIIITVFLLVVGFASVNTVLELNGDVSVGFKYDDFNVVISKIIIDGENVSNIISDDKQTFTYVGTGINNIEYTITNKSYQYDANISLICEPSDGIEINQVGEVEAQSKKSETIESNTMSKVTCRIDIEKISKTEIAEEMCKYEEGMVWTFNYTGSEQEFTVPCDGNYKIELWGAQGGRIVQSNYSNVSYGGYTSGKIDFKKNLALYFYVGQNSINGFAFNGSSGGTGTGGGATDVRLVNGTWNDFDSLKSRIMVAAGAGSSGWNALAGPAGGLNGYSGTGYNVIQGANYMGKGATQTSGGLGGENQVVNNGQFGISGSSGGGGTGGGGYYGGGGGYGVVGIDHGASGGGSSFISGHSGCDAIAESSSSSAIVHTGQPNHYSGYVFTDTMMIDGVGYKWTNVKEIYTGMPTHDGIETMTGNTGHGYAKITLVSLD